MSDGKRRIVVEIDEDDMDVMPVGAALEVETIWHPSRGIGHGLWQLTVVSHE
jgi:hypothetical protein